MWLQMIIPKVNDRIRLKDEYKGGGKGKLRILPKEAKSKGTVTKVSVWDGELTPENHGFVEVKFDCGIVEHFTVYNFYEFVNHI